MKNSKTLTSSFKYDGINFYITNSTWTYAIPFNTVSIKILTNTNSFGDKKSEVKNSIR